MSDQPNQMFNQPNQSQVQPIPPGYPGSSQFSSPQTQPISTGYPLSSPLPPLQTQSGFQGYPPPPLLPPQQQYQFKFSENQMRRYFNAPLIGPIIFLIIGGFFLLLTVVFFLFALMGLILAIVGIVWLLLLLSGRPTDEQYHGWLEERKQSLVREAHRRAFLDPSQIENDALTLVGSVYPGSQEAKNYKEVYKKDTSRFGAHFSINTYTIIFLTKDNLVVFESKINALDQWGVANIIRYYYYEHVSGVVVADVKVAIKTAQSAEASVRGQAFSLIIDSGDHIGSDLVISTEFRSSSGEMLETGNADQTITRLIALLRGHKVSRLEVAANNPLA